MQGFKVAKSFNAPKQGSYPVVFRSYSEGMSFAGMLDEKNTPPVVKDCDGYVIPQSYVYPDPSYSSPASSTEPKVLPSETQKELDKTINRDFIGDIGNLSKGSTSGAMIGAVVGIAVGLYYQKSILMTGFAGLIVGGVIGRSIVKKETNK